jgi:hypothetical protein
MIFRAIFVSVFNQITTKKLNTMRTGKRFGGNSGYNTGTGRHSTLGTRGITDEKPENELREKSGMYVDKN